MTVQRKTNFFFLLIAAAYVIYAAAIIWNTSFEVNGCRYFTLFDDAMVSMSYAKNLAHGHGLVFAPGEARVEGYTNPLWVLWMALIHLLPIPAAKISLLVQISCVLLLVINLFLVRRLAEVVSGNNNAAVLGAVIITAFFLPLNNWSLQGTETALLAPIVTWAALETISCAVKKRFPYGLYTVLGLSSLVRLDMIVPSICVLLFLAITDQRHKMTHLFLGSAIIAAFIAAQTGLRVWYYGDPLPNTYYLKLTGYPIVPRITRGLLVFLDWAFRFNIVLLLLPCIVLLTQKKNSFSLLSGIFAAQVLYSVYAGGDAWEWWGGCNRFISIVMPLFFVIFSCAVSFLCSAASSFTQDSNGGRGIAGLRHLFPVVIILSLINFNSIQGPRSLTESMLITPPLHVLDNKRMVELSYLIRDITAPKARIAVTAAGTLPYFSERTAVDLLGKSDPKIAREMMRRPKGPALYSAFYPGHLKWDYEYSIGELKPDMVVQLWMSPEEALPSLEKAYVPLTVGRTTLYLLKGSPYIRWYKLNG